MTKSIAEQFEPYEIDPHRAHALFEDQVNYVIRCFRHWLHTRDMELINSGYISETILVENVVREAIVQRGDCLKRTYLNETERRDAIQFLKELQVR